MSLPCLRNLVFAMASLPSLAPANAASMPTQTEALAAPADEIDVSAVKDSLRVLSDGHGHYLVVRPLGPRDHSYYGDGTWVRGKANTKLVSLALFPNKILIYTDLGPYVGQRLGTPFDDL